MDSIDTADAGVLLGSDNRQIKLPPDGQPLVATPTVPGYRWFICALLFMATTINYTDRQILSLLKPMLDQRMGWTNAEFGLINAAFQGAYAFGLLGFGWFIDRFGTKIGYALSIMAWSLAAIGHVLAANIMGFAMIRVALGIGEGGNFPAAIKAVALWFPKKERALATSIFNAGANFGAILAPAVVPWLAAAWGWQAAFVAAGLTGFVWLMLWLPYYNTPQRVKRLSPAELQHICSDGEESAASSKTSWLKLLSIRQTWSFIGAKFLTDPIWWFFLIWLPDYFKQTRGLDIKESWLHLVTIYTIVTVLGIGGGWLTGYLARRGLSVTRARKMGMFFFALCVLPIYLVTSVHVWLAVALIGLAGAAHQAWSANLFTTVSDMFPQQVVASVIGLGGMAGALGGMLFPVVTGILLDHFKALGNVTAGYSLLFAFCSCAYLLAFAVNHGCAPSFATLRISDDKSSSGN